MADGYMTAVERANQAKVRRIALMTATDLFARAYQRVHRSPRLSKFADIILAEWPEGDDHLRWVIRGKVGEIATWARRIADDR